MEVGGYVSKVYELLDKARNDADISDYDFCHMLHRIEEMVLAAKIQLVQQEQVDVGTVFGDGR